LCQVLQTLLLSRLYFLSCSMAQPSESSLSVPLYTVTATLLDCMQTVQCCLLLNCYTFPCAIMLMGYFPNLWRITGMICVQMGPECLPFSPKTATDVTQLYARLN
jgi:hypothetical protein